MSSSAKALRLFENTCMTMSCLDFVKLCTCVATPTVYLYPGIEQTAIRPGDGLLAWPALFVLSSFHKKHIFGSTRRPRMRDVSYACARALHSLKWRFVHKYSDDAAAESQWSSIRAKPRQFRPCPFEIDTYTENVFTRIIKSFHSSCLMLRRTSLHMRLARTWELPGIVKLGLRIWKESSWGAVATDKDGGFCIMPKVNILSVKKTF
jgi:hypothetical protein